MHLSEPRTATAGGGRLQRLEALYRTLHANPDLSGREERTADLFADVLRGLGADVTARVGGTGVVGILRNGPGPVVMLRAELDALPVLEDTALAYASTAPGVMHACGHDVHLVGVIGALEELVRTRGSWSGTVLVVGQPAEETLTGAAALLDDGLFERWPMPDVALAQHIAPIPVGVVAHGSALTMACSQFRVDLEGEGAHAALAPWTPNVIGAIADVSRLLAETASAAGALASIGAVRGGAAPNVAPRTAYLLGGVRAEGRGVVQGVLDELQTRIRSLAPVTAELTVTGSADAVATDPELTSDLVTEHTRVFGRPRIWRDYTTNAADDFSAYASAGPGDRVARLGYWMFGGVDLGAWRQAVRADTSAGTSAPPIPGNHSDRFAPHLSCLRVAVVAMATAARTQLASAPITERTPL